MEYRVLARKCRPQVFEEVLGQEHVVRTLQNAITQGRIAHAFLFSGPRGVGKTSIARILAKALNCEQGPIPVPCDVCGHCREITAGNAIDVREIDGASNRGIDEIRELRENVKFAPTSCRYKIYIIDEVHMLTREAFNALLKTLEEPPGHVIFIFATTETQKVPATILSRCQSFEFRRISMKQIGASLRKIAETEQIQISDSGLAWIAEAGDGSLRDSQSIFDQVISYAGNDITDHAVEEILGRSDRRFLFVLSGAVLSRDAAGSLRIIDEAYNAGLDMRYFYQTLIGHFRNLLFTAIAGDREALIDLPAEEAGKLKAQTAGQSVETLRRYLEILMNEEENVRRSMNPRLNLETILCRMSYLAPLIPVESVLARMEGLEKRLAGGTAAKGNLPGAAGGSAEGGGATAGGATSRSGPVGDASASGWNAIAETASAGSGNAGAPESGNTAAIPAAETRAPYRTDAEAKGSGGVNGGWPGYLDFVQSQDPALCAKLKSGTCLSCEGGRLRVGFEKGYLFLDDLVRRKTDLAEFGKRYFGCETYLEIETVAPGPNGSAHGNGNGNNRAARNQRIREIRREALSHPLVLKILDIFPGAEVREVKVRDAVAKPAAASRPAVEQPGEGNQSI